MPSLNTLIHLLIAGICLQGAFSHLAAWSSRRKDPVVGLFGAECLLAAFYALSTLWVSFSTDLPTFLYRNTWSACILRVMTAAIPWFLAYYADRKPGKPEWFLSVSFMSLFPFDLLPAQRGLYVHIDRFLIRPNYWGDPIAMTEGKIGWAGYWMYFSYLLLLAYAAWISFGLFQKKQNRKGLGILIALAVSVWAYVNDFLVDKGIILGVNLVDYAYYALFLVVGVDLGSRRVKAETNYRTLFQNANDAIFVYDIRAGQVVDVNDTAIRLLRATRTDLLGQPWKRFSPDYDPSKPDRALQYTESVLKDGPRTFEAFTRRKDGSNFWAEFSLVVCRIDDREVVLVTIRDVDDRIKARTALSQSEELNRGIVAGFDGFIYICSQDYQLEYMNQRLAERIEKYDPQGLCHQVLYNLPHPCPWCAPSEAHPEETVRWEIQNPRDGRWLDITKSPLHRPDGKVSRLVLFRDITDRKKAEQERSVLLDRVHQGEKLESLGVLAGGAAHDFNNLLTAILGNADLAAEDLPENSPARHSLENLKNAARRAADLARQLLAYSGRGRFKTSPVKVNEVVRDVVHLLQVSFPAGVEVQYHLDPADPAVLGDPTQVRQIAMNLLTNAVEALEGRSGTISLTTRIADPEPGMELAPQGFLPPTQNSLVLFEVGDNGPGMDEETRHRIFEPFYSTKFAGRGLGMAAVLGIVRGHRGAIGVVSRPGEGTRLKVYLPRAHAEIKPTAPRVPRVEKVRGLALVVDDEAMVREAASGMLRSLGWQVLEVSDGAGAVETLRRADIPPDMMLLDLTMPRLDGRQTARLVREFLPNLPIVMMSGAFARSEDDPDSLADAQGFLAKPFTVSDLRECLSKIGVRKS